MAAPEKWFLLEGFTDKEELLRRAGIPSVVLEVAKPKKISGIAFSQEYRDKVFRELRIEEEFLDMETETPGVFYLGRKEEIVGLMGLIDKIRYDVAMDHWNGEGERSRYKELIQSILLPVVKNNVQVRDPHGEPRLVGSYGQERFTIVFFSSPMHQERNLEFPETIWGHELDYRKSVFPYSGEGLPINASDGDNNYTVAELVGNHLYILYYMNRGRGAGQYAIFEKILQKVADHLSGKSDELKKAAQEWQEKLAARARDSYADMCVGRFTEEVKTAEKTVEQSNVRIREYQREIVQLLRSTQEAHRKIKFLASMKEERTSYLNEFDRIKQIPGLKRFLVVDNKITFFTDFITITHDGVEYSIGEFRVTINTANGDIVFYNLTNKGEGPAREAERLGRAPFSTAYNWHHPHIKFDGHACLGNIGETIGQLIGEHRYNVVIQLLIQFLKSVNAEDMAGKGIYSWPKVEKKEEPKHA